MKNTLSSSLTTLTILGALAAPLSAQQLENADLSAGTDPWIAGSNIFVGGTWQAFISSLGGDYTVDSVTNVGSTIVFSSRDDGTSDMIENFLFQEYGAGPVEPTLTVFATGDVIRFTGRARSTRTGADTSDVITRAFIKTLGYNDLGWEFQIKDEYTQFFDLTNDWQDFDLSITYPDLAVDDSLQVIQLGFEITTSFDGAAMDAGTIEFENLVGGVEGRDGGGETWMGFDVVPANGITPATADTGDWLGWVAVDQAPFIFSYSLDQWMYVAEQDASGGAWVYLFR